MIEIAEVQGNDATAMTARVVSVLSAHSDAQGHPFRPKDLVLEARDADGFAGGLNGYLLYGWLNIRFLAVVTERQRDGIGRALLARAEAHVRTEGGLGIALDTLAYQAPGFYLRLGFEEMGRLPGAEPALDRIYFRKRLAPDGP